MRRLNYANARLGRTAASRSSARRSPIVPKDRRPWMRLVVLSLRVLRPNPDPDLLAFSIFGRNHGIVVRSRIILSSGRAWRGAGRDAGSSDDAGGRHGE
jgi:hypothetical protein